MESTTATDIVGDQAKPSPWRKYIIAFIFATVVAIGLLVMNEYNFEYQKDLEQIVQLRSQSLRLDASDNSIYRLINKMHLTKIKNEPRMLKGDKNRVSVMLKEIERESSEVGLPMLIEFFTYVVTGEGWINATFAKDDIDIFKSQIGLLEKNVSDAKIAMALAEEAKRSSKINEDLAKHKISKVLKCINENGKDKQKVPECNQGAIVTINYLIGMNQATSVLNKMAILWRDELSKTLAKSTNPEVDIKLGKLPVPSQAQLESCVKRLHELWAICKDYHEVCDDISSMFLEEVRKAKIREEKPNNPTLR